MTDKHTGPDARDRDGRDRGARDPDGRDRDDRDRDVDRGKEDGDALLAEDPVAKRADGTGGDEAAEARRTAERASPHGKAAPEARKPESLPDDLPDGRGESVREPVGDGIGTGLDDETDHGPDVETDRTPAAGGGGGRRPPPPPEDGNGAGGAGGGAGGGAAAPAPDGEEDDADKPMEKRLMRYIWRWTRGEQIWVLVIVLLSMPTYFYSLTLPVRIINEPIQGQGFEDATATQPFMRLDFSFPEWVQSVGLPERLFLFEGVELQRWDYLIALSTLFLVLVCFNGLFKFYINTYKGRLGERMLRRMRYQLTDRVLRFPVPHFKRVKGSEVASMVKDEVEPFGEFIGDAFVQPLYLGGQALVAFAFIMLQSFWLGLIAVAIIVIQAVIIPILRRRLLELGRQRQYTARLLSGRIGEIVEGILAIRANDTSNYERAEISNRLGQIYFIRYELYQRKFFIKFLNNFLAQLTPFLFYVIGGYFAIRGTLNVGQLIGVINAYKDLPTPINGLIMWDQKRQDIAIKYAQIVEQFQVAGTAPTAMQKPHKGPVPELKGTISVDDLTITDEMGSVLLEDVDFEVPVDAATAAVGPLGSGAGEVADAVAGLYAPTAGRVTINGEPVHELPEYVRGRRFGYAGSESYLPQMTLFETLVYPRKHMPLKEREGINSATQIHKKAPAEAKAAGGSELDYYADWVDYEAMGLQGPDDLMERVHFVLEQMELDQSVYELALRQRLDPDENEELCAKLLEARGLFRERLEGSGLAEFVETFDPDRYNRNATVAENLVFGTTRGEQSGLGDDLLRNEFVASVLERTKLDRTFFDLGLELAETAIELFADLQSDNPFFEQLNFMSPEELELYPPVVSRARTRGFERMKARERRMLQGLVLLYSEPRNRLGILDEEVERRILEARHIVRDEAPEDVAEQVSFYDPATYNAETSVQDNILFGRIAYGYSNAKEQVQDTIRALLDEMGLDERIFRVGLDFDIGAGGKRLSESQRQRVLLARTVLKAPDFMIINRAMNALDGRTQKRLVKRVLKLARGEASKPFGLFWALSTSELAEGFDRVLVFDKGRLVEEGEPKALREQEGAYAALVA